jgi:hypothetical protein
MGEICGWCGNDLDVKYVEGEGWLCLYCRELCLCLD